MNTRESIAALIAAAGMATACSVYADEGDFNLQQVVQVMALEETPVEEASITTEALLPEKETGSLAGWWPAWHAKRQALYNRVHSFKQA